jgi:hypothetical protein
VAIVMPSGHGKDMTTPRRPRRWKTNQVMHSDFTMYLDCMGDQKPNVIISLECERLTISTVFDGRQHLFA